MTERELAALFDHTYLKVDGTTADFDRIIKEAIEIRPATVAVNQVPAIYFKERLKAYGIKVCSTFGAHPTHHVLGIVLMSSNFLTQFP